MSDRPDDAAEIEMTEAMIEAGLDAYFDFPRHSARVRPGRFPRVSME